MSTDCTDLNLTRAMNSRWFLVQGTTVKRVLIMENEKLRAILREVGHAHHQGRNADHLLWLIKKLQRQQALGPAASRARLASEEIPVVARAVEKYLSRVASGFGMSGSQSPPVSPPRTLQSSLLCPGCKRNDWMSTSFIAKNSGSDTQGSEYTDYLKLSCDCGFSFEVRLQ